MTDFTDESVKALLDGATPGAWAVNPKAATNVEAGRRGVAACGGYFDNTSDGAYAVENEANAHLIAAAPDLARALLDARAELAAAQQREAGLLAALEDPLVVHLNMVAGKIAKPLPSQLAHIYGEDVIRAALAPTPPADTWHERRTMLPDGDARKGEG